MESVEVVRVGVSGLRHRRKDNLMGYPGFFLSLLQALLELISGYTRKPVEKKKCDRFEVLLSINIDAAFLLSSQHLAVLPSKTTAFSYLSCITAS